MTEFAKEAGSGNLFINPKKQPLWEPLTKESLADSQEK
jgi:hypothetical protein